MFYLAKNMEWVRFLTIWVIQRLAPFYYMFESYLKYCFQISS